MKKFGLVLILMSFLYSAFSQCIDFDLPASACINQSIQIENLTTAANYEWDFCTGDFYTTPAAFNAGSISGVSDNRGIDIVYDGTNWYGFATGRSSNNIVRFDFGDDIQSTPTSVDLGNVGGILNGPEPIKIMKEDGLWYGLVHNGGGQSLVRLEFGSSLTNVPSASLVLNGVGGTSSKFDLGYSNDSLILVLVHFKSPSQLTIINFNESITNTPGPSDYFTTPNIAAVSWTSSISLIRQCDQWYGISENLFSRRAYVFSFGNTLFREPSAAEIGSDVYGPDSPTRSWVERDNNDYIIHTVMSNGNLHKVNAGNNLQSPSVVSSANLGKLSQLNRTYSFKVVSVGTERYAFSTDRVTGKLIRMKFGNTCDTSISFTNDVTPPPFSYDNNGSYYIGLKAYDSNGQLLDNLFKTVAVSSSTAPDIAISQEYQISCVGNPINFEGVSSADDIQFYDWDFGDGTVINDNTVPTETHTYSATGTYEIILDVTDADPCDNFTTSTIRIFEQPVSSFDAPPGVICSNDPVTFINTVPDNFENNENFEWQINGATVSSQRDLDYTFTSGGSYDVKLITSIPGCTDELIQTINIIEGPDPDFIVSDGCVGTLFEFNNQTTGDNITSYEWDFNNGFTSTDENPSPFEYDTPGSYDVTLTVTNSSGCETNITKSLTVYDLPTVDFINDLACEQAPTQFTDQSTVNNANITSWQWSFDDPESGQNTSTDQNPTHVFSDFGEFDVKLITTSTFGCIDSLVQAVSVNQAPVADFSFSSLCLGEEVQFVDQSAAVPGEQLTSWSWDLGGEFSSQQNPSITFDFPIDYNVSLSVTSQNLCTNTLDSTITVYPIPEVGFDFEDACDNQLVHFYDTTRSVGDPFIDYSWGFEGIGTLTDSSVQVEFGQAGTYSVSHSIETERGCFYSMEESVTINSAPQASFEVSSAFGAPPFEVIFTNTTATAISQTWNFDDGTNANETSLTHTFVEEGAYEVSLAVEDANGCQDTTSLIINALIPDLEVELQQVTFVNNKLILTIINNGTLVIDSLKAIVNLDDRVFLEENINKKLIPAADPNAVNHTLNLNLTNRSISYVCVTLESYLEGVEDSDKVNNTKCKNFESPVIFVTPYPNPAQDVLNIDILSERGGEGTIKLTNSTGQVVLEEKFDGVRGKNELDLDISIIKGGIYLLEVNMAGANHTSRVAIN